MTGAPIVVVESPKPSRRERVAEIREVCDAIVLMVIAMGGSPATAYRVASDLAFGLEDPERQPRWKR